MGSVNEEIVIDSYWGFYWESILSGKGLVFKIGLKNSIRFFGGEVEFWVLYIVNEFGIFFLGSLGIYIKVLGK